MQIEAVRCFFFLQLHKKTLYKGWWQFCIAEKMSTFYIPPSRCNLATFTRVYTTLFGSETVPPSTVLKPWLKPCVRMETEATDWRLLRRETRNNLRSTAGTGETHAVWLSTSLGQVLRVRVQIFICKCGNTWSVYCQVKKATNPCSSWFHFCKTFVCVF